MIPVIEGTQFGMITISGRQYNYDVLIGLNGQIEKRKKKLSKEKYGTSHKISLEEAVSIYEPGAKQLIIGTGQIGYVKLSEEAASFFKQKNCQVQLIDTLQAVHVWNAVEGKVIGMFHVTC